MMIIKSPFPLRETENHLHHLFNQNYTKKWKTIIHYLKYTQAGEHVDLKGHDIYHREICTIDRQEGWTDLCKNSILFDV